MSKFYQIEMPNGETWRIPISAIEDHIIARYGEIPQRMKNGDSIYSSDAKFWAYHEMNWSDVKDHAELVNSNIDYEKFWSIGTRKGEVIEL